MEAHPPYRLPGGHSPSGLPLGSAGHPDTLPKRLCPSGLPPHMVPPPLATPPPVIARSLRRGNLGTPPGVAGGRSRPSTLSRAI